MAQQIKVFLRSKLRIALLAALILGTSVFFIKALIAFQDGGRFLRIELIWATLLRQTETFIYIFALILFLSYDYFREVRNANILEIIKADSHYIRHDWKAFSILTVILFLYSVFLLSFYLVSSAQNGMLPGEICLYFIKMIGVYVFLNGLLAILLGWWLSRTTGRVIGYLCIVLAVSFFSPILTYALDFYAMRYPDIYHWFRLFFIMPQGNGAIEDPNVMFPINLTLASRTIFWLGLMVALIAWYYIRMCRHKMLLLQWGSLGAGVICGVFAWIYSGLPSSFYYQDMSFNSASNYNQWHYVIEKTEQRSQENSFNIKACDMDFDLGRQMKAEVTLYPEDGTISSYDMTLYHLYEVDSVTDQEGRELPFRQEGDYLSVINAFDDLSELHIFYHGGGIHFYSNRDQVYLPGWFVYYPVPGWHEIYDTENYCYFTNMLPYAIPFDVTFDARATIYSELERKNGNHFTGFSSGPTFIAGFVRENCTEDGIRVIYPYLDSGSNPESEYVEGYQTLLDDMREIGKKTIILTPNHLGDEPYICAEDYVVDHSGIKILVREFDEMGDFVRIPHRERTEEDDIEAFIMLYMETREYEDFQYLDTVYESYNNMMSQWGYTKEDFEDFCIEHLGQEEWDKIKEWPRYDEEIRYDIDYD